MNIDRLRTQFRGEILTPGVTGYDAARRVWNGMLTRQPAAIARCTGPADVVAAVRFAAEAGIYPAVRAGGHNAAGLGTIDDGLVIDVSAMKGIFVDPVQRTATAQSGLTWGEFDRETQVHGLATTGGVISSTGIAGLTLGGGVGWLMGRCGLVCDNTLSYDIVTAEGDVLSANNDNNVDLFWALKGGGGNFGVVTSITYRMYPIRSVISGMLLYAFRDAQTVLRHYRDYVLSGLPDELIVYAGAITTPDGVPVIAIVPSYSGADLDEGERLLEPLRRFGSPVADLIARMPYVAMQQMLDAAAPYGIRSYWKANYMNELPDDAIDTFIRFAESCPSPRTLALLEHAHGACARVEPDATAFSLRKHAFDFVLVSMWDQPQDDAENITWTRDFYGAMRNWSAGAVYVNSLGDDDASRVPEAYGRNYSRLCDIKTKYDPNNRFRRNHNIRPRSQTASGSE